MGDFRVVVEATGGHGCQREKVKDGQQLQNYCGNPSCPDCQAREFVRQLKRSNTIIRSATLTHWPGQKSEVTDDLVSGIRKGSF